jgi:hypothetical protein
MRLCSLRGVISDIRKPAHGSQVVDGLQQRVLAVTCPRIMSTNGLVNRSFKPAPRSASRVINP